jgi:hypothetical protein
MRPIIPLGTTHQLRPQHSLLLQSISTQPVSTQIQLKYFLVQQNHMTLKIIEFYCGNSSYGIKGIRKYWLKSYLLHTSTSQNIMVRVQILYREIKHQVQHSSILGPVLCLLYAYDFL